MLDILLTPSYFLPLPSTYPPSSQEGRFWNPRSGQSEVRPPWPENFSCHRRGEQLTQQECPPLGQVPSPAQNSRSQGTRIFSGQCQGTGVGCLPDSCFWGGAKEKTQTQGSSSDSRLALFSVALECQRFLQFIQTTEQGMASPNPWQCPGP